MNKSIDAMTARQQFSSILDEVYYRGDVVTIERKGKPMAVLVPVSYLQSRQYAMERLTAIAEENAEYNKNVPGEEIESAIKRTIKEVRKKNNASHA